MEEMEKLNQVLVSVLLEVVLNATMYWDYFLKSPIIFYISLAKFQKKYRAQVALDSWGFLVRITHLNHLLCQLWWWNYQQNEEYQTLFMTLEKQKLFQ